MIKRIVSFALHQPLFIVCLLYTSRTYDLRIRATRPLPAPAVLEGEIPLDEAGALRVSKARGEIASIMSGRDLSLIHI